MKKKNIFIFYNAEVSLSCDNIKFESIHFKFESIHFKVESIHFKVDLTIWISGRSLNETSPQDECNENDTSAQDIHFEF